MDFWFLFKKQIGEEVEVSKGGLEMGDIHNSVKLKKLKINFKC